MRNGLTITALMLASALTLNAQAPQTPTTPQTPPQTPQTTPRTPPPSADRQQPASAAGQVLTITGCLKEEKDVPGLKPNVAERAGMGEDYILTNVKMSSSSKVSGIALASRYEVDGPSSDELKKHVNHQIEVTGTITQPTTTATDDTPDFKATAVKMVAATCSAN